MSSLTVSTFTPIVAAPPVNFAKSNSNEVGKKLQNIIQETLDLFKPQPDKTWGSNTIIEMFSPDGPFPSVTALAHNVISGFWIKGSVGVVGSLFQFLASSCWSDRFSVKANDLAIANSRFYCLCQQIEIIDLENPSLTEKKRKILTRLKKIVDQGRILFLQNSEPKVFEIAMNYSFSMINKAVGCGLLINSYLLPTNWSLEDGTACYIPIVLGAIGVTANIVQYASQQKHSKNDFNELIESAKNLQKSINKLSA